MKIRIFGKEVAPKESTDSLVKDHIKTLHTFELNQTRNSFEQPLEYDISNNKLIEIQFEDDTIWFIKAGELPILFNQQTNRSPNSPFDIPNYIEIPSGLRGAISKVFIKILKIFVPKLVEQPIKKWAAKIDNHLLQSPGLNLLDSKFSLSKLEDDSDNSIDTQCPVLLLIHGTISNTRNSFGKINGSEAWNKMTVKYGKNILCFEHKTLSKSPLQNALDLIEELPENTNLHIVTHSRGGLVGEILSRYSDWRNPLTEKEIAFLKTHKRATDISLLKRIYTKLAEKKIRVTRFIRVACPAAGTTLLSKRLDHFLNVILNISAYGIGLRTNPVFQSIKMLLTSLIGSKSETKVLPGLEAMVPDSPILKVINNHQIKIANELYIISGNAGIYNIKKTLSYLLARLFYRTDNDFVVDTDSMYMGTVRENAIYYYYVSGKDVDHFSYFKNLETQNAVYEALTNKEEEPLLSFKEVKRDEKNRNAKFTIPGGEVTPIEPLGKKPILILIPGIMWSNLYELDDSGNSEDKIWINFLRIFWGELTKLNINNKNIAAKSVVGTAYYKLFEVFSKKYDVVVFPYDWRKSILDSTQKLMKQINELQTLGQPIKIIAHSMGGLLIRDLMVNHHETWQNLNNTQNFKCILLGTPWKGSYHIPELLVGEGSKIKALNAISLFQSKKDILKLIVKHPGTLQLMPLFGHAFENTKLWQTIGTTLNTDKWEIPKERELESFKQYKDQLNSHQYNESDFENVFYIAGIADGTVCDFVFRNKCGDDVSIQSFLDDEKIPEKHEYDLVFKQTYRGDGSVTWESGIPENISSQHIFYMDTEHGDLANDPKHFDAIEDILETGQTRKLSLNRSLIRLDEKLTDAPNTDIVSNQADDLIRTLLGLKVNPLYEKSQTAQGNNINVIVKNGHLKYASHPIIIGHFKGDGIVSAESVMDFLLDKKLSTRKNLGLYPGNIGTHWVLLPEDQTDLGAIIVGLGSVETLNVQTLSETIELGCLAYVLRLREDETTLVKSNGSINGSVNGSINGSVNGHANGNGQQNGDHSANVLNNKNVIKEKIGISTLFIGSGYGNLSLSNSLSAILEGVHNANAKIQEMEIDTPLISEIEFIELYRDKSLTAFYLLNQEHVNENTFNIKLEHPIQKVQGHSNLIPIDDEREWWKRITVLIQKDTVTQQRHLFFSASTSRARVEERKLFSNQKIIEALLQDNSKNTKWDRSLTNTIFELLIPNDFKIAFRNRQNILWILDKATAAYPWELLHYDSTMGLPICVSAGMIRQLSTSDDRAIRKPINNNRALIIGDPLLDANSSISSLPGAEKEARQINELLKQNRFETVPKIRKSFKEIFAGLFGEFKIIHIASHGVIEHGPDKKTGILLSDNIVLSAAEINQISTTPELVFVNCCHLGDVNEEREALYRDRYKLAANIGTQLIENGVKAVVVAGWAVNDSAAELFAEVFYKKMLDGAIFAEAVKAARKACYHKFSNTNTWGAYQCYGDQFYQLVNKSYKSQDDKEYILKKEILIDLEYFINKTQSSQKRRSSNYEVLEQIISKIDRSGLRNGIITELEADAYSEIEEYEKALEKYSETFSMPDADYSVNAIEQWCNVSAKYLLQLKNQGRRLPFQKEFKKLIEKANFLLKFGETSSRYSTLGSIYKRKAILSTKKKSKTVALKNSAKNYKKAFFLNNPQGYEMRTYPFANWVIVERLITFNTKEKTEIIIGQNHLTSVVDFIDKKLQEMEANNKNRRMFWDWITIVSLKQAKLMYLDEFEAMNKKSKSSEEKKEIDKLLIKKQNNLILEIEADYKKAWKKGGSYKNKTSEVEQMNFIINALECFGKEKKPIYNAVLKLKAFFEGLD